jgi:hypothetical protein
MEWRKVLFRRTQRTFALIIILFRFSCRIGFTRKATDKFMGITAMAIASIHPQPREINQREPQQLPVW